MRVKKYLALTLAAALATCLLTACPWDKETDETDAPASSTPSASRPNDDSPSSSSAPSSSTPDENEKVSVENGKLTVKDGVSTLTTNDITADMKAIITEVTLDGVTVEQGTFADCDNLETVTLEDVTINGFGTFNDCEKLREVDLTGVTMGNDANSTFFLCRALTTVNGANTLKTIPESMFANCSKLQYIDVSRAESIGLGAFAGCTSLTAVDVSNATSIGQSAVLGCNSLKNIRVGAGLQEIGVSAFKMIDLHGNTIPMELTVHCTDSTEDEELKDLFVAYNVGSYAEGYPKFEYNCDDDDCWNQIVSQSQTVVPDAGNALARYLLDLRL